MYCFHSLPIEELFWKEGTLHSFSAICRPAPITAAYNALSISTDLSEVNCHL
jgi:hypothetical protein